MAITSIGSTIQIDSGLATGTASGGTLRTLTGSGFGSWKERIVYISAGTGAGQSRAVKANTATVITIFADWEVVPDATSVFHITYDVTDIVAQVVGATFMGPASSKRMQYAGSIRVISGGFFGGTRNAIFLTLNRATMTTIAGGFLQFGRLENEYDATDGGVIEYSNQSTSYLNYQSTGITRLYGTDYSCNMQGVAVGTNNLTIVNQNGKAEEFTVIGCNISDMIFAEWDTTTLVNNRFDGQKSGIFTRENPLLNLGNSLYSSVLSLRTESGGNLAGSDSFDVRYVGDEPSDPFFNKPVFLYNYNLPAAVFYYWNTKFPNGFANAFRWYGNSGSGKIHEGYSVDITTKDSDGLAIEGVTLGLIDVSGNEGFTLSKNASSDAVKSFTQETDINGEVTNPNIGTNENILVIRALWTRSSQYISQDISYYPFTFKARKYGYVFQSSSRNYKVRTNEPVVLLNNTNITQTRVQAQITLDYLVIDSEEKTITITGLPIQEIYNAVSLWLTLSPQIKLDNFIFINNGVLILTDNWGVIGVNVGGVSDVFGNSSLSFQTLTSDWQVYDVARNANYSFANAPLDTGTPVDNFRFNFMAGTSYYVMADGIYKGQITPLEIGEIIIEQSTAGLLTTLPVTIDFVLANRIDGIDLPGIVAGATRSELAPELSEISAIKNKTDTLVNTDLKPDLQVLNRNQIKLGAFKKVTELI